MTVARWCAALGLALVVLAGCGGSDEKRSAAPVAKAGGARRPNNQPADQAEGSPQLVRTEGVVSLDGHKLSRVMIQFLPAKEGEGRPAVGVSDDEGAFELGTTGPGDGALPGEYRVVVIDDPQGKKGNPPGKPETAKPRVPAMYADPKTTPLRLKVGPEATRLELKLRS